jgi:hypothetical protein
MKKQEFVTDTWKCKVHTGEWVNERAGFLAVMRGSQLRIVTITVLLVDTSFADYSRVLAPTAAPARDSIELQKP